ncbi:hypothetical protein [uncultured Fibrobacter sp.]|uniref:hypothetical protein n=1 Tax=uncultured Fibrobacter sp. TaxID=261512 RepID=UPI002594837F|nr:hypothetical protein [uncultured Fibrobacter sp.]
MQVKAAVLPLGAAFSSGNGVSDFAENSSAFLQTSGLSEDRPSLIPRTKKSRRTGIPWIVADSG